MRVSPRRAQASRLIAWTGERCVPWSDDLQVVYEHLSRYHFAAGLTEGKDVLDLGSGEGYGAALLAQRAARVVGIDIDAATVAHSRANYGADNLEFVRGSALDLGRFPDRSFDRVVCFEMIEHIDEHERLLEEVVRVLRDDGLLVISTPDRRIYSDAAGYQNPFHARELDREELTELLARYFSHTALWGQRATVGSELLALGPDGARSPGRRVVVEQEGDEWVRRADPPPVYLLALASSAPLPDAPRWLHLVDAGMELVRRDQGARRSAEEEAARLRTQLETTDGARHAAEGELARLAGEQRALAARLAAQDEELRRARARIGALEPEAQRARALAARLSELEIEVAERERAMMRHALATSRLEEALQESSAHGRELEEQLARVRRELDQARLAASGWEKGFYFVVRSRTWRATEPLRRLRRGLRSAPRAASSAAGQPPEALLALLAPAPSPDPPPETNVPPPALEAVPAAGTPAAEPAITAFEPAVDPTVSVVIPVHDGIEYTRRCVAALAAHTSHELIEVVVVDDCSQDGTESLLNRIPGLTTVRNDDNRGFLDSCNRGAGLGSGRYLLFLNNDTEVRAGWLEPLLAAASEADDVGAVGSKLIYPDGRLQEAGGLIWADGTGWNVGRGGDPDDPEHNFRREVDYCSAACLLVRRDLFQRLGGFDRRFAPGYYEDVDLCFALRQAGYRVLYEPTSVVVHHEGASHGTDERAGLATHTKASQHLNRQIFVAKWAETLAEHWPPGVAGGRRGGRIDGRPRVLVSDTSVPCYDRDAGSLRMYWILRLLRSLGCAVTLFPLDRAPAEPYTRELQTLGVEVHHGPELFGHFAARRTGLYDLVLLSRPQVASAYLDAVRESFAAAVVAYDSVDLHFLREERRLTLAGEPPGPEHDRSKEMELMCARRSDLVLTVTPDEAAVLRGYFPGLRTAIIPTIHEVDAKAGRAFLERRDLLFIGGFRHPPNADGVLWFVEEILPLVRKHLDVRLTVLGDSPPPSVLALRSPEIIVTGYLQDVDNYFRAARVFVSPLRYGAGMKGKIGHAMGFGLPVVTTSVGAEGMSLAHRTTAMIADDPAAFAEAIVEVYESPALWEEISANARAHAARLWSPRVIRAQLERVLAETSALARNNGGPAG